jgi:hypothetical protein
MDLFFRSLRRAMGEFIGKFVALGTANIQLAITSFSGSPTPYCKAGDSVVG